MIQNMIKLLFLLGILLKTSCAQRPFILIEEPKSWTEAQSYCREKHLDLATVQSDQDRSYIQEEANYMNFRSSAWIGLGISPWRWSWKNEAMIYQKWDSGEPNMDRGQEACAFLKMNVRWDDTSCLEEKKFFCYNENKFLDNIQYISNMKMTWHDAQQYCRTHHTDLATIMDDIGNVFFAGFLMTFQDLDAWIGLSRSFWQWSDQTQVSWSSMKWIIGQPDNVKGNEECVYLRYDGLKGDDTCSVQHPFFCTQIRRKQTVRVTVKSGENLNESTVMAAIEKKVNKIFAVDTGYSVTWRVQSDGKVLHKTKNFKQEKTTCKE
ncbi:macrophage mannose receptor 1-like [Myxocyprinus asiaticus]|uniref:macrophage mannose receptor 1-like n=1 Tax=Myxocyprinus asiaticus TaxID=70543 RepID=UPI002221FCBA|nr:macrophage mannose receptor 1-like [Myxocyprinus asiaticus]